MERLSHAHYVPILKAKPGERRALREMSDSTRQRTTPLIETVFENDVATLGADLARDWGVSHPLMLDARSLGDETSYEHPPELTSPLAGVAAASEESRVPLTRIAADFNRLGGQLIPVVSITSTTAGYLGAASAIAHGTDSGICLRIEDEDFGSSLPHDVETLLSAMHLEPEAVHVVLDLRQVSHTDRHRSAFAIEGAMDLLPHLDLWSSLTVASSSFPYVVPKGPGLHVLPRVEWAMWNQLVDNANLKRLPSYGDYAIQNPELVRIEGTDIMILAPTIRYAGSDAWFVFKGTKPKTDNPQADQMRDICKQILDHQAFSDLSWGDRFIRDCGAGITGPGGATEWRAVGTSRHLALVNHQIATRFGS